MKKIYLFGITIIAIITSSSGYADAKQSGCTPQVKPVVINKTLIQKLNAFERSSANANNIEKLIGPACACMTNDPSPTNETWTCQWKGDFSSNRLENTLNINFAAGSISNITAMAADGTGYSAQFGSEVKVYKAARR